VFEDRVIRCCDCGVDFPFTSGEQEHYEKLGFTNDPKRCKNCRAAKKRSSGQETPFRPQNAGAPRQDRQMYSVKCAECGGEASVPFQPRLDRPVYCIVCFQTKKA
jgi:CxxC-x17-CxxC domain-containing protein